MERDLKRISEELKLPEESRARIRSLLSSREKQSEDIPMKKHISKTRVLLIVAAVAATMALTLTAVGAAVTRLFRNDILVSSLDDIPAPSSQGDGAPEVAYSVSGPSGRAPSSLEKMTESDRFKSDDWETGERIAGGVTFQYTEWDFVEVLSSDPALRSRRVTRAVDDAAKMEYTAENPAALPDTLTGRVKFDLTWLGENYDYVPDANMAFVVTDSHGKYATELFCALYAKPDESAYFRLQVMGDSTNLWAQSYTLEDSYDTAYYYTSKDGYEFLITMDNGSVWAECNIGHSHIYLYGAYLTSGEIEDILDNLSLSIQEQP